jgi:Ca2+-binding RTX toxin-like protein
MTRYFKNLAPAALLAAIGALAVPAVAGATIQPPVINNNTLIVTSDEEADTIVLGTAVGFNNLTINGVPTALIAGNNAQIVVNAGGGDDTVDASALVAANYATLQINGGDGDDLLTGGADNDALNGEAGDDRLVGGKGDDGVAGGLGNDTMVWNNGDANDRNDGEAGNDEVEVNGAPTAPDLFTARPGIVPGRVQFNRRNLGQFAIDLSAERLTVNGLGGGDAFTPDPAAPTGLAGLTSLTLNGGAGPDALIAGDGADVINGGEQNDDLFGGDGDDRLVGDRGADTAAGRGGDDTMVWNNGDGSDVNLGDVGFDRVEVNGSPTAGDVFTLVPNAADSRFERTNLVPFTIDITTSEAVTVNAGGGNDELVVSPGLAGLFVAAAGSSGDDTLTGAEEDDSFFGESGNDTLSPGGGSDLADGGSENDRLFARDRVGDLVRGGPGTDSAQTDEVTVDATSGVESLDATPLPNPPPAGDTTALLPEVGKVKVVRDGRKLVALTRVSCPAAEAGGCRATLTLETAKAVRLGEVRAVVVLGSKSVDLEPGEQSTVRVRLTRGVAGLARHGKLAARVRITSSDAAGNSAADSVAVGLRIPRP